MTTIHASRVGRKPVKLPAGVEVKVNGSKLSIKGAKGHQDLDLHPYVQVTIENNEVKVHPHTDGGHIITGSGKKLFRSIAGTTRAQINNVVQGVSQGFERKLTLVGVGYRAQAKGKVLSLSLGYSHPTEYQLPEGITVETPTQTEILVKGMSKELVGQVAAEIRAYRGPEPYKGKGIRYANEVIEIKETKKK